MKIFAMTAAAAALMATSAAACEDDYMFEAAFLASQVLAGGNITDAKALQQAALARRDQNMMAARTGFMNRMGMTPDDGAVLRNASAAEAALRNAAVSEAELMKADADRRSPTIASNQ